MASRSTGRSTRPFRRIRALVLATSTVCGICGHDGSDSVDHVVPRSVDLSIAEEITNLQPAHYRPCPVCSRRCNSERGARPLASVLLKTSRQW